MTEILVLGAGYTGMAAAIRLAARTRAHITLVNASPRFTERLRLHQTAAGEGLADHAIEDVIAGTGIDFVQARVTGIDPERREVTVDGGRTFGYDKLVYALGTVTDLAVPGVAEHAFVYNSYQEARRLAVRLDELGGGTVVVAGGGLTGVESATEIAEAHPGLHVVLLSRGRPAAMMGRAARDYLMRAMDRLGIEVREGGGVTKVLPDGVELSDGEIIPSEATLWTAGTKGLPLAAQAGLTVDAHGRIVVDQTLRSVSHPDVYAVGDSAAIEQSYGVMHGTCQGGIPTGLAAADSLVATLRGRRPRPFRFGYFHQPLSIGRKDGVIQFTRPDDSPRRAYLKGSWAVRYKETVSSSPLTTYRLLAKGLVPVRLYLRLAGIGS
ncbi:NAD(P)/FAD-dependent oxidoreductase [Nonomuraea sediminis]|uniref:NAD(P)/FAD-dependent oxidoreductase n=1 Tax=Nonomuraea sediminis TaxID=2835864 RepID=UPI001BDC25C3|nr:FAD-dependent oxidoreductase [Nonomuraea sediminis]